jgi:hypothetical protein
MTVMEKSDCDEELDKENGDEVEQTLVIMKSAMLSLLLG